VTTKVYLGNNLKSFRANESKEILETKTKDQNTESPPKRAVNSAEERERGTGGEGRARVWRRTRSREPLRGELESREETKRTSVSQFYSRKGLKVLQFLSVFANLWTVLTTLLERRVEKTSTFGTKDGVFGELFVP
jgi:hypothetical protein